MKVWVILPAFNEADNLPPLLEGISQALSRALYGYGVIVVDDGSRDRTREVALRYTSMLPLSLATHDTNMGLARTMQTGIRAALDRAERDDIVVTLDADNTHPPELIPDMVAAIGQGSDVVIASRYAPGGTEEGVPVMRRVLSLGIGVLLRVRFGLKGVRDYSCGYRAYRVSLLRRAAERYGPALIESRGFTVMAELLVKLRPFAPRIVEVPLHLRYDRKRGPSKLRVLHTVTEYLLLLFARIPVAR